MPRKTLKQRQQRRNPTDANENRVRGVVDSLIGVETADDIMENLIGVLRGWKSSNFHYYTFFL